MTTTAVLHTPTPEGHSLQRLERARLSITRTVAKVVLVTGVGFGGLSVYSAEPPGILACIALLLAVSLACLLALTPARRHTCDRVLAIAVWLTLTAITHVYPNVATLTLFVPLVVVVLCTEVSKAWRAGLLGLVVARFAYVLYLASIGEAIVPEGPAYNYVTTIHCVAVGALSTFLTALFHELGHRVRLISQDYADRLAEQVAQSRALTDEMAAGSAAFAKTNNDIQASVLQQRRLQAELAATHEQLEHFANAASHDLKEPIRTIRSFSQLLRRELTAKRPAALHEPTSGPVISGPSTAERNAEAAAPAHRHSPLQHSPPRPSTLHPAPHATLIADLAFVENSCEDMHRLLEKLLVYQRTGAADADALTIQSIPVAQLWREALRAQSASLATNEALAHHGCIAAAAALATEDSLHSDQTEGLSVAANPERMRSLFGELVRNALTYHDGTREPRLTCRAHVAADGYVHVEIADNGIGIAADYLERVFGMFQRLHAREVYSGAGLGLPLARRIVAGVGGRVSLTSAEGVGTTVHVVLPEG